jgi:hypothetical protein
MLPSLNKRKALFFYAPLFPVHQVYTIVHTNVGVTQAFGEQFAEKHCLANI